MNMRIYPTLHLDKNPSKGTPLLLLYCCYPLNRFGDVIVCMLALSAVNHGFTKLTICAGFICTIKEYCELLFNKQ